MEVASTMEKIFNLGIGLDLHKERVTNVDGKSSLLSLNNGVESIRPYTSLT
jgi:hypothetical protein